METRTRARGDHSYTHTHTETCNFIPVKQRSKKIQLLIVFFSTLTRCFNIKLPSTIRSGMGDISGGVFLVGSSRDVGDVFKGCCRDELDRRIIGGLNTSLLPVSRDGGWCLSSEHGWSGDHTRTRTHALRHADIAQREGAVPGSSRASNGGAVEP